MPGRKLQFWRFGSDQLKKVRSEGMNNIKKKIRHRRMEVEKSEQRKNGDRKEGKKDRRKQRGMKGRTEGSTESAHLR